MKVLRNFQLGSRSVASVFNLDVIKSDYNDYRKFICDSGNAPSSNTQLLEWECDAQTDRELISNMDEDEIGLTCLSDIEYFAKV